jgi:hypothetical protein
MTLARTLADAPFVRMSRRGHRVRYMANPFHDQGEQFDKAMHTWLMSQMIAYHPEVYQALVNHSMAQEKTGGRYAPPHWGSYTEKPHGNPIQTLFRNAMALLHGDHTTHPLVSDFLRESANFGGNHQETQRQANSLGQRYDERETLPLLSPFHQAYLPGTPGAQTADAIGPDPDSMGEYQAEDIANQLKRGRFPFNPRLAHLLNHNLEGGSLPLEHLLSLRHAANQIPANRGGHILGQDLTGQIKRNVDARESHAGSMMQRLKEMGFGDDEIHEMPLHEQYYGH